MIFGMTTSISDPSPKEAAPADLTAGHKRSFQFREMRLRVGDRVQVEPPPQVGSSRASARVVGWVEGQCIILTGPQIGARRTYFQAGEVVVVRVFTGRSAFAFGCTVLKTTATPVDYVHLSFPDSIAGVDVRSSPRVRLNLGAKAAAQDAEARDATIDNIGCTGALIVCGHPLGAVGDSVSVEFDVVLHDVPVSLSLRAAIRSIDNAGDGPHRYGVSFVDPGPNDRLILAALIWFNMYENPRLSA
jgi:hypothetical protein